MHYTVVYIFVKLFLATIVFCMGYSAYYHDLRVSISRRRWPVAFTYIPHPSQARLLSLDGLPNTPSTVASDSSICRPGGRNEWSNRGRDESPLISSEKLQRQDEHSLRVAGFTSELVSETQIGKVPSSKEERLPLTMHLSMTILVLSRTDHGSCVRCSFIGVVVFKSSIMSICVDSLNPHVNHLSIVWKYLIVVI
jgi:hypothetical protein